MTSKAAQHYEQESPRAQLAQHAESIRHRPILNDQAVLEMAYRDPAEAHRATVGNAANHEPRYDAESVDDLVLNGYREIREYLAIQLH
jgi:hypothetical protein